MLNTSKKYAKHHWGQNFLVNPNIISKIGDVFDRLPDKSILEIGAGHGALTAIISNRRKNLTIVEIDSFLVVVLQKKFPEANIIQGDILKTNMSSIFGKKTWHVIGSLPYNITSPLLLLLLNYYQSIDSMIFILQDAVVQRIVARPNNKNWGRLSIAVQHKFDAIALFEISQESFDPKPKVLSRLVTLTAKKSVADLINPELFALLTRTVFSYRRKTLLKSLQLVPKLNMTSNQIHKLLKSIDIDPQNRPENLSIEDFIRLTKVLNTN